MKLLSLLIAAAFAGQPSLAKMAALQSHDANQIVKSIRAKGKSASEEQMQTLKLAQFGIDAVGLKSVTTHHGFAPDQVKPFQVRQGIEESLMSREFTKKPEAEFISFIKQNKAFLKESFQEDSYGWAWMRYHLGEKKEAKDTLIKRFDKEHERVMAMQSSFKAMGSPFQESEAIQKALKPQLSAEENAKLEEKMRQMKSHISQLPDSGIVT